MLVGMIFLGTKEKWIIAVKRKSETALDSDGTIFFPKNVGCAYETRLVGCVK